MFCCKRRAGAADFVQAIAVLRHSERLDHVDEGYRDSAEGKAWPFDTPLTEHGILLARDAAERLRIVHAKTPFTLIISSPYRRCLHTAAVVAKSLGLPVVLDQEVGEVWDEEMPTETLPHRSPVQLQELAKELGVTVLNPAGAGGFQLFGERPQHHPETLPMGHKRCLVRIQDYIGLSATFRHNFVICTHAAAVAVMVDVFQRGMARIDRLDYCGCVTATRKVCAKALATQDKNSAFADGWDVEMASIEADVDIQATEESHLKFRREVEMLVAARRGRRSRLDEVLEELLRSRS